MRTLAVSVIAQMLKRYHLLNGGLPRAGIRDSLLLPIDTVQPRWRRGSTVPLASFLKPVFIPDAMIKQ